VKEAWRFHNLPICFSTLRVSFFAYALIVCLTCIQQPLLAESDHGDGGGGRAEDGGSDGKNAQCAVPPIHIAQFANGESFDYRALVSFVTQPECLEANRSLSKQAITFGVQFENNGPWKLNEYSSMVPLNDVEGRKRVDETLAKEVPVLLRENPLGVSEMLPLIGQLALLSPSAARASLVNIIEQELYSADSKLSSSNMGGYSSIALSLAKTLVKLGANEPMLASELANNVEDLAILSQADSLGKILRGLGAAAIQDPSLSGTFNLSSDALNRGVQKGKKFYPKYSREALLLAVFTGIRFAVTGNEALESGAGELNEALAALLKGQSLNYGALKKMWMEALKILSESNSQSALAEAFSLSITPAFVFLPRKNLILLMKASRNYGTIAASVQTNFLFAWKKTWDELHSGKMSVAKYNRLKEGTFEPIVEALLDLGPGMIDARWLKSVVERGLLPDSEIERRFPRYVLSFLGRRDKAARDAVVNPEIETTMGSMAENFRVLWTLSNVHVPALMNWVRKNAD
jgi:hypothetical protein